MLATIGVIVWTLQAVKYFDFVTQDGHGLKIYFSYIVFNFPKIIKLLSEIKELKFVYQINVDKEL